MRTPALHPQAFLRSLGFVLDKKPHQIDRLLLRSLSPEDRESLQLIWAMRNAGYSDGLAMYGVPKTLKQAALLFSHDWKRAEATMSWFHRIVDKLQPSSVTEMGCGAGFLLNYLQKEFQGLRLQGVDEADNLILIGSDLTGSELIRGDYLNTEPDGAYDLVICDFGFDNARFVPSQTTHSIAEIEGVRFCPGCSQDLKVQLDAYLKAWRQWVNMDGCLAIAGRFSNFGQLKALVEAASEVGWYPSLQESTILVVEAHGIIERFPALLFVTGTEYGRPSLEDLARFYVG